MKRRIVGGLLLLLVASGILFWWQDRDSQLPSQIAPAGCLIYLELPKVIQSAKRWPDTALSGILSEASVQRFLRQPISKAPANYQNAWNAFSALRCSALFTGMADPHGDSWICGVQTSVDQSIWRPQIATLANTFFGQEAKEVTSETLAGEASKTGGSPQIYCVRAGSWILVSRSAELLLEAVRNSKTNSGGLQSSKVFQECHANVPTGYDLLSFVKGGPSLDSAAGLHWSFRDQETQGNVRAVMAATTIVGARVRDTVFSLTGPSSEANPLERKGLAMTSPSTIGYVASQAGFSEIWQLCSRLSEESPLAETIRNYMGQVQAFGIEPRELDSLISGAEIIIDRDPKSDALYGAISLQVSDAAKFQHLMDRVATEKFPDNCKKIEIASVPAYLMQVNERVSIVFGLAGRQALITGSQASFAELVQRLQTQSPGLESDNQFKATEKMVADPNDLFAYLDAKAGFERFYEASRPMLVFGILLTPALSRYVDAMALPETEDIGKHLSPIVLSRHRANNGVIDESVGPITAYDAVMLLLGGAFAMGLWER
jgi:hypothetical protein